MTSPHALRDAATHVEQAVGVARGGRPWNRGLWLTARPSYRCRPLSSRLRIEEITVRGVTRRIARADGRKRPLLILPGLYARLEESLFADLADRAVADGFPVILLEDRLAAPTLTRTRGEIAPLHVQGEEAAAVAAALGVKPDVLALSAGVAVALAAPPHAFASIVGWSSAVDLGAVRDRLASTRVLRWYFTRVHRRAFADAGLSVPSPSRVFDELNPSPPQAGATCALLIHAADDPVAPPAALDAFAARDPRSVVKVLARGGHLGFGVLAGHGIYTLPFEHLAS
jgi:hypothetical protein